MFFFLKALYVNSSTQVPSVPQYNSRLGLRQNTLLHNVIARLSSPKSTSIMLTSLLSCCTPFASRIIDLILTILLLYICNEWLATLTVPYQYLFRILYKIFSKSVCHVRSIMYQHYILYYLSKLLLSQIKLYF